MSKLNYSKADVNPATFKMVDDSPRRLIEHVAALEGKCLSIVSTLVELSALDTFFTDLLCLKR